MTTVHVVVPDGIDDPTRPSGGNTYDRQVCRGLGSLGWSVHEHAIGGCWPRPDGAAVAALTGTVGRIPDDAVVLLDGLVASTAPEALVPQARRMRLVVLVHMPLGHRSTDDGLDDVRRREQAVLSAAAATVTTSAWTRDRLLELYGLPVDRVHVVEPGVASAELAAGTPAGDALLCVAAVRFDKGHDVLLDALATISDVPWHCVCVGSLDREPAFAEKMQRRVHDSGVGQRVEFTGPRTGTDLGRAYAEADLLVLPSRAETYGMVITEALARGVPVVATEVGGVTEALGHTADGRLPGVLVPSDDAGALAGALRAWLGDSDLRARLRRSACQRRDSLPGWPSTASTIAEVLASVAR